MVAWFLFVLMFVALAVATMTAGVRSMAAAVESRQTAETVERVELVARQITARLGLPVSLGAVTGADVGYIPAVAPAGVTEVGIYRPPIDLALPRETAVARPMIYCPFAPANWSDSGGSDVTVLSPGMPSYVVGVRDGFVVRGRPDWASSFPPDVVGLVLASHVRVGPMPRCDQVTYDSARDEFTVPFGVVRPVRALASPAMRAERAATLTIYVSPGGRSGALGDSPNNPAPIQEAINRSLWAHAERVRIVMAPGVYILARGSLTMDNFRPSGVFYRARIGGHLIFEGNGSVVFIDAPFDYSGGNYLSLPTNITIRNLALPNAIIIANPTHRLEMENVGFGAVLVYRGVDARVRNIWNFTQNTIPNFSPFVVVGGRVHMSGTIDLDTLSPGSSYGMYIDTGSDVVIENARVRIYRSGAGETAGHMWTFGSKVSIKESDLYFDAPSGFGIGLILSDGSVVASRLQASRTLTHMIWSATSGNLHIENSRIGVDGVPPMIGVSLSGSWDFFGNQNYEEYMFSGVQTISGRNSLIGFRRYTDWSACGQGFVFDLPGDQGEYPDQYWRTVRYWQSGSSAVGPPAELPPIESFPVSDELRVKAHLIGLREAKRAINRSDWQCVER